MRTILRLMVFTRKYWPWLLLAFLCLIANTVFSLAIPRMLGIGIDTALGQGERGFLVVAALVVLGASILRGLSGYGNTYFSEVISQKTAYDIRNALYDRLQHLSFAYHDQSQTGQLMSRATVDVDAIQMFFGRGILSLAEVAILSLGISYVLIALNWQLALLTLAFMPLVGWRALNLGSHLRPIWLKIQRLMGILGAILEENLTGVRIVKAFSRQPQESQKFAAQATHLYDEHINLARLRAFNVPMMVFLISLPVSLILWYGGRQVIAGGLTIGDVTQFILYIGMLAMPIRRLAFMTTVLSRTASAGQRILEILDAHSEVKEKPDAIELSNSAGEVRFEGVSFSYGANETVLKRVSFRVQPGELVALLGGSGSGKSTIAHLIPRFYDPTEGRISIDGTDIRDLTLASLRRNVGIVQQNVFLFSASVRDNIAYGALEATDEQVVAAAKAAYLHDFIQGLAEGYDTWVGERGVTLSGGEKQRLVIARTLLTNPKILILDDSTSSVDAETERLIYRALSELIKGRTTFIITHRLQVMRNADLILMLKDGEVVEQGKHTELMSLGGYYRQVYQSQLLADREEKPQP
jgi:ATP-binding cassette subfamily B protein